MTITVRAGMTLARLQETLAAENQRLPIDVPHPDQATLGGALATNISGPRRYGFGTLRDYVLGISAVNDEGCEIKAGGRVVKNVAGYDLCKLLIGSLGTLGIITQVTLKVLPHPEEQALVVLGCRAKNVEDLLEQLHGSRTRPVCLELLNPPMAQRVAMSTPVPAEDSATWQLVVGYEGNAESVKWQVQQLVREVRGVHALDAFCSSPALPGWQALIDSSALPLDHGEGTLAFKANLLPGAVGAFCLKADALPSRPLLKAHAGNGVVIGRAGPGLILENAVALVRCLRDLAARGQGRVVVLRCPPDWKRAISVWGDTGPDIAMVHAVK